METRYQTSLAEQSVPPDPLTPTEREFLRAQIAHTAESIAPNWPINTFISRNPLSGFEHLHFDMAVRRAQELMGGRGYLSTEEYREAYRNGRITYQDLRRAFRRIWFSNGEDPSIPFGRQQIHASDILILHLVHGIDGLIPRLYQWKVQQEGATQNFRADIPSDIQQRTASQSRERLRASLNRIAAEMTISDWVYRYNGLNLPHFIHDLIYKDVLSSSDVSRNSGSTPDPETPVADQAEPENTAKQDRIFHSLGLLPEQFEGYRQCLKHQFRVFQTEFNIHSMTYSEYEARWLDYEVGALSDVVDYLCGKPGNLLTLKTFVEAKPEGLHLKGLWANVLRTFGLVDPELPERLGGLLTKPAIPKIRMSRTPPSPLSLGFIHSMSTWVSRLSGEEVVDKINDHMIRWCSAFVDEGLSSWSMPERDQGFYLAWRELATRDYSGLFSGMPDMVKNIQSLPDHPEDAIAFSLKRMGIPRDQWEEYLTRHLAHLPGWVGYIRWRSNEPEYPWQKRQPINPVKYLAVRLFYEAELVHDVCQREWRIPGTLPALESYFQHHWRTFQEALGLTDAHADETLDHVCHDAWRLFELAQFLELFPEDIQELPGPAIQMVFEWLNQFPDDRHGLVWQEAYEDHYRQQLLGKLLPSHTSSRDAVLPSSETRPQAQAVFCIDVRSEPLRRHLEAQGQYDTIGFAGFFGIPITYRGMGTEVDQLLCPVLLKPKNVVRESPRSGNDETLRSYDRGLKWTHLGHHLFHDLKSHPIASLMLIDILGSLYALTLFGKTLIPAWYRRFTAWLTDQFRPPVPSHIPVEKLSEQEAVDRLVRDERRKLKQFLQLSSTWNHLVSRINHQTIETLHQIALTQPRHNPEEGTEIPSHPLVKDLGLSPDQFKVLINDLCEELGLNMDSHDAQLDWFTTQGFSPTEQAFNIERCLKVMGLTTNFARVVLVCGHGSTTENNPYASGYDCGACGGNHGGPNARVLAAMANKPEVRRELKNRGIEIPEDTWFLPGEHNTTTDEVQFFDLEDLPETHKPDVDRLKKDLEKAELGLAQERCRRLPGAPQEIPPPSVKAHTRTRSLDWSQVRPEWGLSRNAAFIIGKRSLTRGINLEGRTFLHNYNAEDDESGKVLETIMTAPMVVAEWINLQYYFSAVDPWVYGSGSKVLHNVVSGIGVMAGSQSDFQSGLPLQAVRDGKGLFHEPLRLTVLIQAPTSRISEIIQRHTILQYFVNNQWIHLVALEPQSSEFLQYIPGGTWKAFVIHSDEPVGAQG